MLNISLKFPTTISSFFITISPSHWYPYHLSYIEAIMSPIIYSAMTSKDLSTCGNIFPFYSRPTIIMDDHGPHEWPIRHPSFLNLLSFLDLHFHSSPIVHSNTYTLDLVKISQALQLSLYSQLSFDTQPFISTTVFSDYFGTFSHSAPLFIPTISPPTYPQPWESNIGNLWPLLSHTPWFSLTFSQSTNMPPSSPSLPGFLPISHLSHLICPPSGLTYVWATSSALLHSSTARPQCVCHLHDSDPSVPPRCLWHKSKYWQGGYSWSGSYFSIQFYLTTWPPPGPRHTEPPTVPKGTCAFCEFQPLAHGSFSLCNVLPTFFWPGRCLLVC